MPINWQDGAAGGTPLSAANLNRLAVIADLGATGTPTGDAVKAAAAAQVTDTKMAGALGSATAAAIAGRAELKATFDVVDVANSSGDVAVITAALAARTSGGKLNGASRTSRGKVARISSPTTITLGYSNTQNANWATDTTTEKVRLSLDILPDANLGSALTIRGGYGVELDINVLGGGARGSVADAAVSASSTTVSSPAAIAAGLQPGAVVFITGAGAAPEGIVQPRAASVRTVNSGAGTFTISEAAETTVSGATMTWFDVAVRIEDCVGLKLNLYGKGFQGYLLAGDAADDATKRIRSSEIPSINANGNGGTIFWKSIEAFGSFGNVVSTSVYGDYFGQCADTHCGHYEGGITQPTSSLARAYVWFDRCGQLNNWSVSVGDRATEAAVLMTGNTGSNVGSMGRFAQIRATMYQALAQAAITSGSNQLTNVTSNSLTMKVGQTVMGPGIPDGTTVTAVTGTGSYTGGATGTVTMSAAATATSNNTQVYSATSDGVKLIGVQGITITNLDTARSVAGLHIIGGGGIGVRVLKHVSITSDLNPLVIEGGTTGTPRIEVNADYRYHGGYSVDLRSGLLTGSDIRLSGYMEGAHSFNGGALGKYVLRSASSAAVLDIAGLHQKNVFGASGLIDPATIILRGVPTARLENQVPTAGQVYQTDGSGGFTLATPAGSSSTGVVAVLTSDAVVTNTTTETPLISYTVPANSPQAGTTYRVHVAGNCTQGVNMGTVTFRLRYGGITGASIGNSITIAQTGSSTTRTFSFTYDVTFRGGGASVVMGISNVYFAPGTSGVFAADSAAVSTTADKTLQATVVCATADPTNIITAYQGTVELLKA